MTVEPTPIENASPAPFRLGEWTVEPALNLISSDRKRARAEPRVMRVLTFLAARPGQVVSRETLLDAVWPGVHVGEDTLTRAISELRKIFEDDAKQPRYIETIRKGGYRLAATPQPLGTIGLDHADPLAKSAANAGRDRRRNRLWAAGVIAAAALALYYWPPTETRQPSVRPFTTYLGEEFDPDLSADGTAVAFSWGGLGGDNVDIYVKQENTETPLRLTRDPGRDIHAAWSPDGDAIAFVRIAQDAAGIYTVPAIGGPERKILETRHWSRGLSWSPDGRWLVFADRENPDRAVSRLALVSLETLTVKPLTRPPANKSDHSAVFSADGSTVAFVRDGPAGALQHIFVISAEGGEPRQLTDRGRAIRGLTWAPGHNALLFSSALGSTFNLWRLDADTGLIDWIDTGGRQIFYPAAARRVSRLVYEGVETERNIWRFRPDASPPEASVRLIASTLPDYQAVYSPDGSRVAFISARSGAPELWLCGPDGEAPLRVTHFRGPFLANPCWSPDGRFLAFNLNQRGRQQAYLVSVDGGRPRLLSDQGDANLVSGWSPDGRRLYLGSDRDGAWQIWSLDVDTGQTRRLTRDGGLRAQASTDGAWLYYSKPNMAGLWRKPLAGGEERRILNEPAVHDWDNWRVARGGLYLAARRAGRAVILRYDEASQTVAELGAAPRMEGDLAAAPHGRAFLYTAFERYQRDILLLEEF